MTAGGAPRRAARRLAAAAFLGVPVAASACTLVALEHRSGRELMRQALPAGEAPQLQLGFVHSVLGTPVSDRYRWHEGRWLLVEESFEGEGYGLPHAAGPGERLERRAGGGARLLLERVVDPLVVRPLPAQGMRLTLAGGRSWALADLAERAVQLTVEGC